jgi:hypothetical protein
MATQALSSSTIETPADPTRQFRQLRLRQRILQANALTGITSGPALALGAPWIARLVGLDDYPVASSIFIALGATLTLFALVLFWAARRSVPPSVMLVIGAIDALWVAASAALLLSRALPLNAAAAWIVAIQADVIALLAAAELLAWWRGRSAA